MTAPARDLRSDTVTLPTAGMRDGHRQADVGDDVYGEDPTICAWSPSRPAMLGKGSRTVRAQRNDGEPDRHPLHTRSGDELICDASGHPYNYEAGGAAMLSGRDPSAAEGERGLLDASRVDATFRWEDPHYLTTTLVIVEDTSNRGGGTQFIPSRYSMSLHAWLRSGSTAHLDGARMWNAWSRAAMMPPPLCARSTPSDVSVQGAGRPRRLCACRTHRTGSTVRDASERHSGAGCVKEASRRSRASTPSRTMSTASPKTTGAPEPLPTRLEALGFPIRPVETNMVYVQVPDGARAAGLLAVRDWQASTVSATRAAPR